MLDLIFKITKKTDKFAYATGRLAISNIEVKILKYMNNHWIIIRFRKKHRL